MSDSNDTTPKTAAEIRAAAVAASANTGSRGAILIPEWGGSVYIRTMTGDERAAFDRETARRKKKDPEHVRARERLVIATATDQAGTPIFTAADENTLAAAEVGPCDKAFKMACRLNGYVDDEDQSGN